MTRRSEMAEEPIRLLTIPATRLLGIEIPIIPGELRSAEGSKMSAAPEQTKQFRGRGDKRPTRSSLTGALRWYSLQPLFI